MVLRHGSPNRAYWTDVYLIILHGTSPLISGAVRVHTAVGSDRQFRMERASWLGSLAAGSLPCRKNIAQGRASVMVRASGHLYCHLAILLPRQQDPRQLTENAASPKCLCHFAVSVCSKVPLPPSS